MAVCAKRRLIGIHADGGLAQFLAVPAQNLVRLPDTVPFPVGAIIADAVATPFHALSARAALRAGESIAIFGVGGLGLHAVQLARLMGAGTVIAVDVRAEQLKRARHLGADAVVDSSQAAPVEEILRATGGRGVDVAAEFVGLPQTIGWSVESLATGGRAVVAGLGAEPMTLLPPNLFVRKELAVLGSYGFTKRTIETLVQLAAAGKLDLSSSVTHTFALDEVNDALAALHEKRDNPVRVVVAP
jgi:2-desacetyl-2-hydroxyethyl bacteriochlorophyllide A dehydrogenase